MASTSAATDHIANLISHINDLTADPSIPLDVALFDIPKREQ